MTQYIVTKDGKYLRHAPRGPVEWGPRHYQPADTLSDEERAQFGIAPLVETPQPVTGLGQIAVEDTPVFSGGGWQQTWKVVPGPVPEVISDRQFAQVLALNGLISRGEALAWVKTGDLPRAFLPVLAQLPEANRFAAEMELSGATQFMRSHPTTAALAAALGYSDEQVDGLWRVASTL